MQSHPVNEFPWGICAVVAVIATSLIALLAPSCIISSSLFRSFLALFLAQILVLSIYRVILYPKYFSPLRHLPGPSGGSFLLGHFTTIVKEPAGEPSRRWNSEIPNDGLLYYKVLFNEERLLVTGSKALAEVLVQKNYDFIKPKVFVQSLGEILGIGVLIAEGDEHKFQRKNLMPALTYRHTKDLYPLFWSKSCEMVRAIARESRTEEQASPGDRNITVVVDIASWVSRATLDIIGLAGMGQDFNALQDPRNELIRAYEGIFEQNSQAKILGILGLFLPRWFLRALPFERNQKLSGGVRTIRRVSHELIQQKKRKMGQEKRTDIDILSVALESGAFTDENLVDQMMTFLAAGHDTTATSLIWAVYQLSQQPEVQARLRDEIRQGLPSIDATAGPPVTAQDLDRLPFLHAVCNEVLRLYPPVRLTLRAAAHDTSIQGQFVPAGTLIILAPIATNTDVTLWGADAGEFKPERWLGPGRANTGGAESNYAFLTFLHGPRSCIGKEFARAEFACLLAALVGRFEMELADKDRVIELVGGITTKPKGGLPVRMRMIDGW